MRLPGRRIEQEASSTASAPGEGHAHAGDRGTSARLPLWVRVGRWPALAVGLMAVGGGITYVVAPPAAAPERVITLAPTPTESAATTVAPMPSVTGLSLETARTVLRDAGAPDVTVDTTNEPAPGPAGLIVTQKPAAGSSIGDHVAFTLSTPMTMPKVTGKSFTDARAALLSQGAVVRTEQVIKAGAKIGTVLSTVPAAGQTMPTVVTLNVADPGRAVALSDLSEHASDGCYSTSSVTLGNKDVPNGIACPLEKGHTSFIEYKLNGKALTMAFTAGYDSYGGRGDGMFRILGDGTQIAAFATPDTPAKKRVAVDGVTTLRIEASGAPANADNPPLLSLGNAVVQGKPSAIDTLANQ